MGIRIIEKNIGGVVYLVLADENGVEFSDANPLPNADAILDATVDLINGAVKTTLVTRIAGERNTDSETNNYLLALPECNASVISKTTAVTIGGGAANDTMLVGVQIVAALTGTCVITGFVDSDGATQSITLPAATPAGFVDFRGAINSAGALTFTCSNASDDNLVIALWRAR